MSSGGDLVNYIIENSLQNTPINEILKKYKKAQKEDCKKENQQTE